jgi:uncharacterized membrane protein
MAELRRVGWGGTGGRNRLDQPRVPRRLRLPRLSGETFGHFAEGFARNMGTPRFIAYMTIFVMLWIALNVLGLYGLRWDPYPFILLNLAFSTQASYAAPLILLAQNRQADRDRLAMDEDRRRAAMQKADTEYLSREIASLRIALGEVATRDFLRSELVRLVEELDQATQRRQKLKRKEQRRAAKLATTGPGNGDGGGAVKRPGAPVKRARAKTDTQPLDEPYDDLDSDLADRPGMGTQEEQSPRASRG